MGSRTGSLERVAPREAEQVSRGLEMRRAGTGGGRAEARRACSLKGGAGGQATRRRLSGKAKARCGKPQRDLRSTEWGRGQ